MILALIGTVLGLTITLGSEASARGQEITLGEIATITGDDAELVRRAQALTLGYTPMPGYWRVFPRWQIEQKLRADLAGAALTVVGPEACKVLPMTEFMIGADIGAAAERELRGSFAGRDATLRLERAPADVEVPMFDATRELKVALDRREPCAGAWQVPVQIWIDGTLIQTVFVPFQVELYETLPVLVRDVRRGEVLGLDAIELRRTKLAASLSGRQIPASAAVGAVAARDLGRGAILVEKDIERALVVKKGDSVQVVIQKGAVSARSIAVAAQDGYVGDRIKVVTVDRKKELVGIVRGKDGVLVDLGSQR